jgi:hypothetical protein
MFVRDSSVRYRPVPGFPGYEVGDDGSVWSYWYRGPLATQRWRPHPVLLKQRTERGQRGPRYFRKPYKTVSLTRNGRLHLQIVNRIVLLAFVGPCPEGMETRHLDNDPANNRLSNLAWGTKQENGTDKRIAGSAKGHRNGRAKLTADQVDVIRRRYAEGELQIHLASEFGVTQGLIGVIVRRENWTHV